MKNISKQSWFEYLCGVMLGFKKHLFGVLLIVFSFVANSYGYDTVVERQISVSMRAIGHQVLLSVGDSTSRVLPITKVDDRYKISFASELSIDPDKLVATVDQEIRKTNMASSYLVELENLSTGEVVYAYKMGGSLNIDEVACKTRALPVGNFSIMITILELDPLFAETGTADESLAAGSKSGNELMIVLLIIPFSVLMAWSLRIWKRRKNSSLDPQAIHIGDYHFDKRNMELSIQDERTELTSKEADLLYLLHSRANATVERDVMLKEVWGDEGDYVGRTLDVFISKLRKKLEADPRIRIANIRGVGYKLILND